MRWPGAELCSCLQAKSSKVSARQRRVSDAWLMWQQNVYIPQGCMWGEMDIFVCLIYDIIHLLRCRLFSRQQVQPVWAHKCVITLSAYQTVLLDADLWLPTPPPPLQVCQNPQNATPARIPFLQQNQSLPQRGGFYFEITAWINHEPPLNEYAMHVLGNFCSAAFNVLLVVSQMKSYA